MKQKFYRTKKFQALEKIWEKKLSDSGFIDAEKCLKGTRVLRQRATNSYRAEGQTRRENKQRYFELLGIHYHEEEFPNARHEFIIRKRASGFKIKEICKELKKSKQPNHRETVRKVLRFYEAKWKIVTKSK